MQELIIRLQFNQVCLGAHRRKTNRGNTIYALPRAADGKPMCLPAWWYDHFRYAATLLNRCQSLVTKIRWDPVLQGKVDQWRRVLRQRGDRDVYMLHEAFRPGTVITVKAVIPHEMTIVDFQDLLIAVGTYRGLSFFRSDRESYGTFSVVSIEKLR